MLVIDDEPSFCAVVCEILSLYGFRTQQALGARHALGILKELRPDLILTDVMMPDVDGLSLLRLLRSDPSLHGIPTIVITARCEPSHLTPRTRVSPPSSANTYTSRPSTSLMVSGDWSALFSCSGTQAQPRIPKNQLADRAPRTPALAH